MTTKGLGLGLELALAGALPQPAAAEQSKEDVAKQLANPVAALISVPFQLNYNQNLGPVDDGERWLLSIQPVIPFSLLGIIGPYSAWSRRMSALIESKRARWLAGVLLCTQGIVAQAVKADDFMIPLEVPQPNFVGLGVGGYPDYLGSEDTAVGVAPLARLSLGGDRFVRLLANDIRVNLLDDPNWRLGPAGVWRLGRDDVDDDVVRKVHEIDQSVGLGLFGGYVWRDPAEVRRQAGVGGWALADVSGVYDGWTAGLNAYAMQPVAPTVTVAGGAAFTYGSGNYMDEYFGVTHADSLASGLPIYVAGSGVRDVRGWALAMLHLSRQWHLGAGGMYMRLVGDAADSPIVSGEGSKDQWIYGVGALYAW